MSFIGDDPGDDDAENEEPFWLGDCIGTVGSSRGERYEVKWFERDLRGRYRLDGTVDIMKLTDVLVREVTLLPAEGLEGRYKLPAGEEAKIQAALALYQPDPAAAELDL